LPSRLANPQQPSIPTASVTATTLDDISAYNSEQVLPSNRGTLKADESINTPEDPTRANSGVSEQTWTQLQFDKQAVAAVEQDLITPKAACENMQRKRKRNE